MGDHENPEKQEMMMSLELGPLLRSLAFDEKPEAFRLVHHLTVHLLAGLPGGHVLFEWDPQDRRSLKLVVVEEGVRPWHEETHILKTRRFSSESRRERRLTLPLEIDPESDVIRCRHADPSGIIWRFVGPEHIMEIVEEAKVFWSRQLI